MLTSFASKWWQGMRVCMCVFNSGMNLILIPPTLGMGNSCLNELNSGFKIASICSQSELAPAEAARRLWGSQFGGPLGMVQDMGLAGPRSRFKAGPATRQVTSPWNFCCFVCKNRVCLPTTLNHTLC